MTTLWCCALARGGVRIAVQVAPHARRTEVLGIVDAALKIRLQAQPVDGQANAALVKFVAGALGVSRTSVTITRGHTHRRKLLDVDADMAPADVERRLLSYSA